MIVVVPLQQLLAHRNELAQRALHLLVLGRVIDSNVQLNAHRLYGTIIAVLTLVRLVGRVAQRVLPHYAWVARIERTHLALERLFSCKERERCP